MLFKSRWHRKIFHETRRRIAKLWYETLQTDLNLDTIYNLPITLLKLRPKHKKLVLEYGIDQINEMDDYHLWLVKPQIAIMTGITPVHSDKEHLGSLKNIVKEKRRLLEVLPRNGLAILNFDDKHVHQMAKKTKAKVVWYGLDKKADFWADKVKVTLKGTQFRLHYPDGQQKKMVDLETGLIGRHFLHACLAAFVVGLNQGLSRTEIAQGMKKLKPLPGRVSLEKGPHNSVLIDDSLRANPASTQAGLELLAELKTKQKKIAVLGEMGELGKFAKIKHQEIGKLAAKLKLDYLIAIGPLQKLTAQAAIKKGMSNNQVFWVTDILEAAQKLQKIINKNDLLYLKGSRLRHLERLLLAIKGKQVGCRLPFCHYYHHCQKCPYLKTGPSEV
jgi:UDP-N-acetylmuramoyl-tripeptide--D-alanyl-D-alanine ligase